jgi:hypothetical protein
MLLQGIERWLWYTIEKNNKSRRMLKALKMYISLSMHRADGACMTQWIVYQP